MKNSLTQKSFKLGMWTITFVDKNNPNPICRRVGSTFKYIQVNVRCQGRHLVVIMNFYKDFGPWTNRQNHQILHSNRSTGNCKSILPANRMLTCWSSISHWTPERHVCNLEKFQSKTTKIFKGSRWLPSEYKAKRTRNIHFEKTKAERYYHQSLQN